MMDVISTLEGTIDTIDKSSDVKRLKELKALMNSDKEIQQLLNDFNILKKKYETDNVITDELIAAKGSLYKHPVLIEYRNLYSKLNVSFLKFNKNIESLLNDKKSACGKF
jgi:cell fate (sporulation/competence/biofilm development) regulator YlbF (YheA/YmcA/DUF963 family)